MGKLLSYQRNITLWDVLLEENDQLSGGNFHSSFTSHPCLFSYNRMFCSQSATLSHYVTLLGLYPRQVNIEGSIIIFCLATIFPGSAISLYKALQFLSLIQCSSGSLWENQFRALIDWRDRARDFTVSEPRHSPNTQCVENNTLLFQKTHKKKSRMNNSQDDCSPCTIPVITLGLETRVWQKGKWSGQSWTVQTKSTDWKP